MVKPLVAKCSEIIQVIVVWFSHAAELFTERQGLSLALRQTITVVCTPGRAVPS